MAKQEPARWWSFRPAQNRKPATYRCPICNRYLPALSEHTLLTPEGDSSRRRHAHTACVMAARQAGRLPTRDEWLRTQPRAPSRLRSLIERIRPSARDQTGGRAPDAPGDQTGDRAPDAAGDHAPDSTRHHE